jgi:hypothetical protein
MKIEFDIFNREFFRTLTFSLKFEKKAQISIIYIKKFLPVIPCDLDMIWVPDSICCPDSRSYNNAIKKTDVCVMKYYIVINCNKCMLKKKQDNLNITVSSPAHDEVYSIQNYVIKFVLDLRQVGSFLLVFRFPPPIKVNAMI